MAFERRDGTVLLSEVSGYPGGVVMPPVYQKDLTTPQSPLDILRNDVLRETFGSIRRATRQPETPLHAIVLRDGMTAPHVAAAIGATTAHATEELYFLSDLGLVTEDPETGEFNLV